MRKMTRKRYPPGPKGHFIFGSLPDYSRDPIGFATWCAQKYGDIVYFRGFPFSGVQLNHPDYIEEVLVTKRSYFYKGGSIRILDLLLGNGLITSEGDFWHHQRRLMQPAFHWEHFATYGEVMTSCTNRLLLTWQDGQIRDVHQDMMRLAIEIVAKTLFGADIASQAETVVAAMQSATQYFETRGNNALLFLLPDWVPIPDNLRFRRVVQWLDTLIYDLIEQRRSRDEGDLLSILLKAQDENVRRMTNQQLRDEMMTLFLAGHETIANALSWTWYLLSQHPEIETKLVEELQAMLRGGTPTVADLPSLRYTERVVMESLRLYPPVWAIGRTVLQECEIAGYLLRPGNFVFMSQWVMHHDPRFFDQPDAFNPDRWAGSLAKRLPTFAYFPFGGGPRVCIGKSFAMMEVVLLIAMIAQQFQFTLVPEHPVTLWPAFTLRPKHGIRMLLTKRKIGIY